jgi:hypothetical protein
MFTLNALHNNRHLFSYGVDLTGFTVFFRAKNEIENTTAPIVEVTATITSATASLSAGYFDIDLTAITTLNENFYYEVEITDGVNPPLFNIQPVKGKLITRLDN